MRRLRIRLLTKRTRKKGRYQLPCPSWSALKRMKLTAVVVDVTVEVVKLSNGVTVEVDLHIM